MDALERFLGFIDEHGLFTPEERILLAVSGGKDSVFMTHLFAAAKFNFGIAHCNFHLRGGNSDRDEEFVRELATHFHVPFYRTDFDTKAIAEERHLSIQMAARDLRYAWFEDIRNKYQYEVIALAQHQTDSMETMLLNLVRGTGIRGLHGILPKRGNLIRPLLGFTSEEIGTYVEKEKINYREDASNNETKYARNKIRLDVLPALRAINPTLESTFAVSAQRFRALETFLETQVNVVREAIFLKINEHSLRVRVSVLQPYIDNDFVMYELFRPFGFSMSVLTDLDRALQQDKSTTGKVFYSQTHSLLIDRGELLIKKLNPSISSVLVIDELPKQVEWNGKAFRVYISSDTELPDQGTNVKIDADKVALPISIRSWRQGDSFKPLGFKGRKKISDFLINQKVPLDQKTEVPLFVNANGDILWVAPWRIDDRYKITPKTQKVIIFEQL